jgi:exosortase A-associated hydrolase 2
VPPFAEELNKCRRMLALAGQQLAQAGWHVVLPDLGGTGDSHGDFGAARVEAWLDDLVDAAAEAGHAAPVTAVVGLRLGACLAVSVLPRLPGVQRLVFWQPVVTGQQHLTQFLRLRVAGNALAGGVGQTVAGLRAMLAAGESLEVAGYALGPGLASDLDRLRLTVPAGSQLPDLYWLEVSSADPPVPGPLAAGYVQQWTEQGGRATATACGGEPFWSTMEIGLSQPLLDRTVACLAGDA